jgi:D-alanyl-D-alanine endopeptidase (penicillin-binding protein 7)
MPSLSQSVADFNYYPTPTELIINSSSTNQFLSKPIWSKPLVLKDLTATWPRVTAQAAAVVDWQSGQILWQKNPDQVLSLASLTKLLTAEIVLENNWQPEKKINVPPEALTIGIKTYLAANETFTVADIFKILLMASSNEAAEALAAQFGRSRFIEMMNDRAQTLGLSQTNFVGPSGLEAANQATITDFISLAQVVFGRPLVQKITSQAQDEIVAITANNGQRLIAFENTNKLLAESEFKVIAGKTGTLDEAGFSVASVVKKPGARALLVVILGSVNHFSRFEEAKALADWAWQNYQ